ncbi:MAG: LysR family transcriptional regulator [Polaromonas sp.]|nr:LysR family transcriptional regulator [Polaromonas sp.]
MNQVNFQTPDLNLLRVSDEVMTERSLTRAARKLSISQPAISSAGLPHRYSMAWLKAGVK